MPDPKPLGELIAEYMARARERAKLAECPLHPRQSALNCSPCAADRNASSDREEREAWDRTRAMAACDESFPRRFRDAQPAHPEVVRWVEAVGKDIESAPSLLLLGPQGRGKTWLAYGALRAALLKRPRATWASRTFPDFAASLRPRAGVDTEAEIERFRSADLLLLDDLGTAKGSEWVEEITYRLINGRYEAMRPTVFTTNLTLEELRAAIGDRISGRLAETCIRVLLDGQDRRRAA